MEFGRRGAVQARPMPSPVASTSSPAPAKGENKLPFIGAALLAALLGYGASILFFSVFPGAVKFQIAAAALPGVGAGISARAFLTRQATGGAVVATLALLEAIACLGLLGLFLASCYFNLRYRSDFFVPLGIIGFVALGVAFKLFRMPMAKRRG